MIEARLADGTVLRFPDGTSDVVVDSVVKQTVKEKQPKKQSMMSYLEPAATMASGIGAEVAGGLAGLGAGLLTQDPAAAAGVVDRVRNNLTYEPRTEEGRRGLQSVGKFMQPVGKALETAENYLGDAAFNATGSPAAGAAGKALPTALMEAAGLGLAMKGASAAPRVGRAVNNSVDTARDAGRAMLEYQSPAKRAIAGRIAEGSMDADTAPYRLAKPKVNAVGEVIDQGGPKVIKDAYAIEAIRQGFDEGVVARIKQAGTTDKTKMLQMVDILERGKKDAMQRMTTRPSDIAGKSLTQRINAVSVANRKAADQLDDVAKSLKGQVVDISPAMNTFLKSLDGMGIKFGPGKNGKLRAIFQGSDIEGSKGAERIISNIIARMRDTKVPDAYDVHRLKKFIDESVSYGKAKTGLTGRAEGIVKELRHELDGILDTNFKSYDAVNSTYAETRRALDAINKASGTINLGGNSAEKGLGTLLRRLEGNVQSRAALIDALDELESVAKKHANFSDDLRNQVLFAEELDAVFGPVARTSFQGQISSAMNRAAGTAADVQSGNWLGLSAKGLGKAADKLRNVNDEAALKAIRELLKTTD